MCAHFYHYCYNYLFLSSFRPPINIITVIIPAWPGYLACCHGNPVMFTQILTFIIFSIN